jgi:hypothetical protein
MSGLRRVPLEDCHRRSEHEARAVSDSGGQARQGRRRSSVALIPAGWGSVPQYQRSRGRSPTAGLFSLRSTACWSARRTCIRPADTRLGDCYKRSSVFERGMTRDASSRARNEATLVPPSKPAGGITERSRMRHRIGLMPLSGHSDCEWTARRWLSAAPRLRPLA